MEILFNMKIKYLSEDKNDKYKFFNDPSYD